MDSVQSAPARGPTDHHAAGEGALPYGRTGQAAAPGSRPPGHDAPPSLEVPSDYVPAAESGHELYQVHVDSFVGPLDLLLFLIRRHALDIFDIPMAFVCRRYLDVLDCMAECDIDVAAEFLAVAAELLHIKSKMLLPQQQSADEAEESDPRAALVRRLLLLEAFQKAARTLEQRPLLGRDVFAPAAVRPASGPRDLAKLSPMTLASLWAAIEKKRRPQKRHQVMVEQIPLRQRMHELLVDLHGQDGPLLFGQSLARLDKRIDIIVLFLAVLELAKQHLLTIGELLCEQNASARAPAGGNDITSGLTLLARCGSLAESERRLARVEVEKAFN